jgi:hypothetical protein
LVRLMMQLSGQGALAKSRNMKGFL